MKISRRIWDFFLKISKRIREFIAKHPVLSLNLLLLLSCLMIGTRLYAGKLVGQGDDVVILNPLAYSSEWEFLRFLYLNWGGVGAAVLVVPWRILIRVFQVSPDLFPWWLFASLNLFLIIVTPINLIMAGRALLRQHWATSLLLLGFIYAVWVTSPIVYQTTIGIPFSATSVCTLPPYLISLGVLLLSKTTFKLGHRESWVLAFLYSVVAVNESHFMLSLPIVFGTITLIKLISQRKPFSEGVKILGFLAIFSVLAALFAWTTPGFHKRGLLLQFAIPDLATIWHKFPDWYMQGVRLGYSTLFPGFASSHLFHTAVLLILLLGLIVTGIIIYRNRRSRLNPGEPIFNVLSLNLLSLGFISAFHVSMATLLFTQYFPDRTRAYPALLLAVGLGSGILWLVQASHLSMRQERRQRFTSVKSFRADVSTVSPNHSVLIMACIGLAVIGWNITVPNLVNIVNGYRAEVISSQVIHDMRQQIINMYSRTGQTNYRLSGCPEYMEFDHGGSFRFSPDYFEWRGYPTISTVREGVGDTIKYLGNKAWTRLECNVPPLFPSKWLDSSMYTSAPVRTVMSVMTDKGGVEDFDFWVSKDTNFCTLTGVYHPSIGSSALYNDAFEYRLLFGTTYSRAVSPPAISRVMEVHPVGYLKGFRPNVTVTIGFLDGDGQMIPAVAMDAFGGERSTQPLLRVSIAHLDPAYLYGSSSVALDCR